MNAAEVLEDKVITRLPYGLVVTRYEVIFVAAPAADDEVIPATDPDYKRFASWYDREIASVERTVATSKKAAQVKAEKAYLLYLRERCRTEGDTDGVLPTARLVCVRRRAP